jgi:hypothetical protein
MIKDKKLFGIRNLAVRLVAAQKADNPLILKRIRLIHKFILRQELVIMVLLLYNAQPDSIIATLIQRYFKPEAYFSLSHVYPAVCVWSISQLTSSIRVPAHREQVQRGLSCEAF